MSIIIKPRRTPTTGKIPTVGELSDGEFCINTADKIIYQNVGGVIVAVSNFSPSVNYAFLTADASNTALNTIADVGNLSFPVIANKRYAFRFFIVYMAAATATGSRWSINGTANGGALTTSALYYRSNYSLTVTSRTFNEGLTTYDAPANCNATSAATASNIAIIEGEIVPTVNGIVTARFAAEVALSAITAKANLSYVEYQILG